MLDLWTLTYYKHLLKLLETNSGLKKTIKGNLKQKAAWTAGLACVGGVVAGPPGALVVGLAGFILVNFKSDEYNSMLTVIRNLPNADTIQLVANVQELVGRSSLEALTAYIGSQEQRELLVNTIRSMLPKK